MPQIRLNKTPELEAVLAFLRDKYRVLSEAEIIKVALAEKYKKEVGELPMIDNETEKLIAKGMGDIKAEKYTDVTSEDDLDTYLSNL